MATIKIWCLLVDYYNHPFGSCFRVKVDDTDNVDELLQAVKKEAAINTPVNQLVVWRCKDRSIILKSNNLKEQVRGILSDGLTEKLDTKDIVAHLELSDTETLFVQMPDPSLLRQVLGNGATTIGPSTSKDSNLSATSDELQAVHNVAWGKPWPTRKAAPIPGDMMDVDMTPADDILDDNDNRTHPAPSTGEYICLVDIQSFAEACQITTFVPDVIVVRDEYITLREALEARDGSFVLTGQPGIGKTLFLIYLLLHRLEKKLPTAVQFQRHCYLFFDENGVKFHHYLNSKLSASCWALTDSNADVDKPCEGFRASRARIVQTTSLRPKRWKAWLKYAEKCSLIVVDLPKPLEIATIAQQMGYDASTAIALMERWGPCTRTIIGILQNSSFTKMHALQVRDAALELGKHNSVTQSSTIQEMDSRGSPLLFIFPIRDSTTSSEFGRYIPTTELLTIYEESCKLLSNKAALNLFEMLSVHPLTRSVTGWRHEKQMHLTMTHSSHPLKIVRQSGETATMQPSRRLLPLTQGALRQERNDRRAFYWFPPDENFEGTDGVLADPANIFVLQATIASKHRSPLNGLRKVWGLLVPNSEEQRNWHFIAVVDNDQLAMEYAGHFGEELAGSGLGKAQVPIQVWGCVLPKMGVVDVEN